MFKKQNQEPRKKEGEKEASRQTDIHAGDPSFAGPAQWPPWHLRGAAQPPAPASTATAHRLPFK